MGPYFTGLPSGRLKHVILGANLVRVPQMLLEVLRASWLL